MTSTPPLPTTAKEVTARGWTQLDIILFSGDAYIDHPSFGVAVIARLLEAEGYKVAVIPQPNWQDDLRDFKKLGKPRLFFGVSGGNMDSMVNHYTAACRRRSNDAYTPGGRAGARPDYAVSTYTKILKGLYPDTPVIIGGIEASLRRLAHYDYWSDTLMPSILKSSGADLLCYGMGEAVMPRIAKALHNGFNMNLLRKIPQVAFLADKSYIDKRLESDLSAIILNSFEKCESSPVAFGDNFKHIETESNRMHPNTLIEPTGSHYVVVNAPFEPLTTEELDRSFALPYTRRPHPKYRGKGDIPAFDMIRFSVNMHRGCYGGCSFCTISAHQGKFVTSRSEKSIIDEIAAISSEPEFKGYLSDLGGPSANMYGTGGADKSLCSKCKRPSCIYPAVCGNLEHNHDRLIRLYRRVNSLPSIKKAFIGSGIRYDMIDEESRETYLREVIKNHTSGRLKVAPEHTEDSVLKLMRKPSFSLFKRLNEDFKRITSREGLKYQLIPYFISSHPGCTAEDMKRLSTKMKGLEFRLEQVQDFTPTPMTLSSVVFHTGIDPYTGQKTFVEHNIERKKAQKEFFFK